MTTTLRIRSSLVGALFALLGLTNAAPAHAQEVTRMPEGAQNAVGLDTGLESAFIARATYARRVDLGFVPDARLFGRYTLPIVNPDLGDWSLDGGVRATPVALGDFRLALLLGPVVRNSVNEVFTSTAVGMGATVLVGYEGPRWGISAEGSYEQILTTHLRHTARYREEAYPDAKDGWYSITGSTVRGGLRGGARFGAVEVWLRAGLDGTGKFHALAVPFQATVGGVYAF